MKLTYGGQTIDLFGDDIPKKVCLSVSGGLDSASLMYLICKHFPEIELIPYTGHDVTAPMDHQCALDIIQFMRETFPNANIGEHHVFTFDIMDPKWRAIAADKWEEEMVVMPDGTKVPRCTGLSGLVKLLMMRHHVNEFREKHPDGIFTTGMTANPPIEEQKKYGFYDVAERRRDDKNQQERGRHWYQPYVNVDKKFVAAIYKEHDLMEDLYPFTSSCVGFPDATDYYTEPCGECFWCHEKEWAFNT